VKPANVLLRAEPGGRYVVKLVDFGLATLPREPTSSAVDSLRSADGHRLLGTPAFMAPETWAGRHSVASDLWAVGVMMFQCLTGRLPFPAAQLPGCITSATPSPRLPLEAVGSHRHLVDVVAIALNKDEDLRYSDALCMRAALVQDPGYM